MHTQHLADIGLNVHILEMLVRVGMKQPEGRIQSDGHPDTIADPGQLPYLALFTRMGVKRLLLGDDRWMLQYCRDDIKSSLVDIQ